MIRVLLFITCCALGACANGEPLPPIQGPWYQLNSDRWQLSEAELQQLKALPEK